jgi:hypothetical protein
LRTPQVLSLSFEHALKGHAQSELKQVLFPPEPNDENFGDEAWRQRVSSLIEQMSAKVEALESAATTATLDESLTPTT